MNKLLVLVLTLFSAVVVPAFFGCTDTDFPLADLEVRIEDGRFFPNNPDIQRGMSVRWVNFLLRSQENVRTVTSGSPGDSTAGALFDEVLEGRVMGEAEGDDFIWTFNDPGEFPYFSRFPEGAELTGTVVVR